jgi:pyridoxamine 5'-phosphate oxidase
MSTHPPELPAKVVERFRDLWEQVLATDLPEPTAVVVATAGADGRPSSRTVLLKAFDARGFVFYTNLKSRKGRQLEENPHASLTFYWPPLARQVQVEGPVERVSDAEADAYWRTRARDSRLGAWASKQSEELPSRAKLVQRVAEAAARYGLGDVPRPDFWSGLRVRPERVEFWTSKVHRLHERELWVVKDGAWVMRRLYP